MSKYEFTTKDASAMGDFMANVEMTLKVMCVFVGVIMVSIDAALIYFLVKR